jgi:hypothetical protein
VTAGARVGWLDDGRSDSTLASAAA